YQAAKANFEKAKEYGFSSGKTAQGLMVVCIKEGKLREAMNELKQAVETDAGDQDIYRLLLDNLSEKEKLNEVFGIIFSYSDDKLQKAVRNGLNGCYKDADIEEDKITMLTEVLGELQNATNKVISSSVSSAYAELNTNLCDRYTVLAIKLATEEKFDEAQMYFDKAEELNPDSSDLIHLLGDFLVSVERYEEGIGRLEQVKSLIDVYTPYGLDLIRDLRDAYFKYGKSLLEKGEINRAIPLFRKFLITSIEIDKREDKGEEDSKELYEFFIHFLSALADSPEGIEQGIVILKELEKTAPRKSLSADLINYGLGKFYYEKSRCEELFAYPEMFEYLDKTLQHSGKMDKYAELAAFHIQRERGYIYLSHYSYRRAKNDFEKCLRHINISEKSIASIRVMLGVIDEISGNHLGVIGRLEGIEEEMLPISHQIILNQTLGDAYSGVGDLDRALDSYREALKERTLFSPVIRARLAGIYRKRGKTEKAEESCELALKEILEDMNMIPDREQENIESRIENLESNRHRIPKINLQPASEVLISLGSLYISFGKEMLGKRICDLGIALGREEVEMRKEFRNKVPNIDLFIGIKKEVLLALADEAFSNKEYAFWGEIIEALGKKGGREIVSHLLDSAALPFLKEKEGKEFVQNLLCALLWTKEARAWEEIDRIIGQQDKKSRKKLAKEISGLRKKLGKEMEARAEKAAAIEAIDVLSERYSKYHRLIGEQRDEIAEELLRKHISLPDLLEMLDKGAPATGWKQTIEVLEGKAYLVEFECWEKYDFEPEVILEVTSPAIDGKFLIEHKERLKKALIDSGIYQRWSEGKIEVLGCNLYPRIGEKQGVYEKRREEVMDAFERAFTEIENERRSKATGSILNGYRVVREEFKEVNFTLKEFQKKRTRTDGKLFSKTTIRSELNGLVALGILEVDKSAKPYIYILKPLFQRGPPDIVSGLEHFLQNLPARPEPNDIDATRLNIKNHIEKVGVNTVIKIVRSYYKDKSCEPAIHGILLFWPDRNITAAEKMTIKSYLEEEEQKNYFDRAVSLIHRGNIEGRELHLGKLTDFFGDSVNGIYQEGLYVINHRTFALICDEDKLIEIESELEKFIEKDMKHRRKYHKLLRFRTDPVRIAEAGHITLSEQFFKYFESSKSVVLIENPEKRVIEIWPQENISMRSERFNQEKWFAEMLKLLNSANELEETYFDRNKTDKDGGDKVGWYCAKEPQVTENVDRFTYRMPKKSFEILKGKIKQAVDKGEVTNEDYEQFLKRGLAWIDKRPKTHFINSPKIYSLAEEAMNTVLGKDNQIRDYRDLMRYIRLCLRTRYIIRKFKKEYNYDIVRQVRTRLNGYSRYNHLLEFYRNQYGGFAGEDGKEDEEALLEDLITRFVANRALGSETVELLDEKGITTRLDDFCPLTSCVVKDGLWMFENGLDKINAIILKNNVELNSKYKIAKEKQEKFEKKIFHLLNKTPYSRKQLIEVIRILDPQAETRLETFEEENALEECFDGYLKED
ncbi:MAG: hypothetical protein KAU58_01995, partial [Candidatus Omnitrophica bacterium]|nr:hypothetical protein [Candidatus Omnitrophota bacterium]